MTKRKGARRPFPFKMNIKTVFLTVVYIKYILDAKLQSINEIVINIYNNQFLGCIIGE